MKPLLAALCLLFATGVSGRNQWTAAEANAWYARQPWMVGAIYIPSSAVNQLEMWQPATFNPQQIDRELGWAQRLGMNTMRVFLHDLLWDHDAALFRERVAAFLAICARHHMRVLFVLFDSDWQAEPKLGPQNPPIPGIHNSGWVQSPGLTALRDIAQQSRLEGYVRGIIGAFAADDRIVGWDLWNEPSGTQSQVRNRVEELLPKVFAWARSANPTQPLTSGVFQDAGWAQGQPSAIEKVQLEQSDVLSFHDYHWPESLARKASILLRRGRPVWCTEYLARGVGSTFDGSLPVGKELNVAMINWGLVDGKTQTRFPWDSWQLPYVNGREPAVWHHDILHPDGTPYRPAEAELIRALASAPRGVVPGREPASTERGGAKSKGVPQK